MGPCAVIGALVMLSGCSVATVGSSAPDESISTPTAPLQTVPTTPTPTYDPALRGTLAPADLVSFRCRPDAAGRWQAVGTLENRGHASADYAVSVRAAAPDPTSGAGSAPESVPARRRVFTGVAGGARVDFRITRLPVASTGATCQVQVVRLS